MDTKRILVILIRSKTMKFPAQNRVTLASQIVLALALASQITACVPLVVGGAAAGGAIAADRRTSGIYIEDQNIELKAQKSIDATFGDATHVNVTSFKGNVLLTGEVTDADAKARIENHVKTIESVRNVTNELVVGMESSLSSRANDSYLTSKVKAQFVSENRFQANYVKVVTENSVVYLMGVVTQAEADAAVEIARNTSGVEKVVKVFEYIQ
jgi:osmotically-inducible protein OsmY